MYVLWMSLQRENIKNLNTIFVYFFKCTIYQLQNCSKSGENFYFVIKSETNPWFNNLHERNLKCIADLRYYTDDTLSWNGLYKYLVNRHWSSKIQHIRDSTNNLQFIFFWAYLWPKCRSKEGSTDFYRLAKV